MIELQNQTQELRCQDWNGVLGASAEVDFICHVSYILLGLAFVLPSVFPEMYATLAMRTLITSSATVSVIWAKFYICAVEVLLWDILILIINLTYTLLLIKRHFPVGVPLELREVYTKIFFPFKMSKRQFREVTRGSRLRFLQRNEVLFFEQSTRRESSHSLSILMNGKLNVKYEGIVIHRIKPFEFIDSIEYGSSSMEEMRNKLHVKSSHESLESIREDDDSDFIYQVTVEADEDSTYLHLNTEDLRTLSDDTRIILNLLVGKDVAQKLYDLSDLVVLSKEKRQSNSTKFHPKQRRPRRDRVSGGLRVLDFHRTVSLDAMDTGCKGYVRSIDWINKSERAKKETLGDERVLILNFELDVPPTMEYLPHDVPVNTMDKSTLAEAQFLAQQRKYWPSGFI
ncbi:popeye domain-containing protein 1 [Lepeophtheirus salmonis]|uniref:popeye domain-containing protein 1 n=1 Tax=Lepeophtheirus salmonis TaxID=72036 RepID=UPI001AE28DB7|nr:blood vessel epicardial substance-like [Lepeophtheirus salmonis]